MIAVATFGPGRPARGVWNLGKGFSNLESPTAFWQACMWAQDDGCCRFAHFAPHNSKCHLQGGSIPLAYPAVLAASEGQRTCGSHCHVCSRCWLLYHRSHQNLPAGGPTCVISQTCLQAVRGPSIAASLWPRWPPYTPALPSQAATCAVAWRAAHGRLICHLLEPLCKPLGSRLHLHLHQGPPR